MTSEPKASQSQALDLRGEVDRLISAGSISVGSISIGSNDLASRRLADLWRVEPSSGAAAFLVSRFEKLRGKVPLQPYRLAVLRSFTVEPAIPLVRAEAFVHGIDLTVQLGDFNAYPQEILDSNSSLYRFAPDAVILAAQTADLAPELWNRYADLAPEAVSSAIQSVSNNLRQWIRGFRERSSAALVVHSLELPAVPSTGLLDAQTEAGASSTSQSNAIQQINQALRLIASEHRGVYVLDYDGLVARHGRLRWHDERKWLVARMPIAADCLIYQAREWLRFLIPLCGKTTKVLVTDLDNTLWGGIIGEDGMTGIKLSAEYPGAGYQNVQRALLDLSRRGILLAISSKNNLEDAMQALTDHPGMLLKPKDFSAVRINWNDKAQSLREIASDLNVGTDALAFLDDNPVEREQIRNAMPEVTVVDLPEDPLAFAGAIRDCPAFERLTLSSEDQQRTGLYAAQRERSQAEQSFQSKEDFFRYLDQEAEVSPVSPATLTRVAQLTQKTNQFNLTTRRYTEQQIAELAARPEWQILSISVRDRFGDHGLVGVAITRDEGDTCEIEAFLLSCRVIGRAVETALLSHLAGTAAARGRHRLSGRFIPTKKNAPAGDFYASHGFQLIEEKTDGSVWTLPLQQHKIATPDWIRLKTTEGVHN
jgi:FkbH-like protein